MIYYKKQELRQRTLDIGQAFTSPKVFFPLYLDIYFFYLSLFFLFFQVSLKMFYNMKRFQSLFIKTCSLHFRFHSNRKKKKKIFFRDFVIPPILSKKKKKKENSFDQREFLKKNIAIFQHH